MNRLFQFMGLLIGLSFVACASKPEAATVAPTRVTHKKASPSAAVESTEVSSIAQREIHRRQEMIRNADRAALKAGQLSSSGDLSGAVEGYRSALQTLPTESR